MTSNDHTIPLDNTVGKQGTITFEMTPSDRWETGATEPRKERLLEIPGFATLTLYQHHPDAIDPGILWFHWDLEETEEHWRGSIDREFPELPEDRTYHVQITWDSERNFMDAYIDGNPIDPPAEGDHEWDVSGIGEEVVVPPSSVDISNVETRGHYVPVWRAPEIVPDAFRRKNPELWGVRIDAEPRDVHGEKGDLIYEAEMSDPSDIADWPPVEGPGDVEIDDGWLHLTSPGNEYHHVLWCPEEFPDRFVAEWEVKIASEDGLCIVFFAATGNDGQDIFAPDMPERTSGDFGDYNRDLDAYHVSYYAGQGRLTANMRKDGRTEDGEWKFYLMDQGPAGILAGSNEVHRIRLIKDGGDIQLQVDGEVHIDVTDEDDGDRFGPRYHGGKIGFRQMVPTEGYYRNLRVWELRD